MTRCARSRTALGLAALGLAMLLAGCSMPYAASVTETDPTPDTNLGDPPGGPTGNAPQVPVADQLALAIADVSASERDAAVRFTVSLNRPVTAPVSVSYATEDGTARARDGDYEAVAGTLTFAADTTAAQQIEVPVGDDAVAEGEETFTVRLSNPQGAMLGEVSATATIIDDDAPGLRVEPRELNVFEGATAGYRVALGSQPTGPVSVTIATGTPELSVAPERLVFTPRRWAAAQTVTITASRDDDAIADAPVQFAHAASGGGYDGASVPAVRVTIVEADVATLAVASGHAAEGAGTMRFAVTLSLASAHAVTVDYTTEAAGHSATVGQDYAPARGALTFPAGSTAAQTVAVTVLDDELDEPDEQLTLRLHRATAPLAGGEDSMTTLGTIADDDDAPTLRIADAAANEAAGGAAMRFVVSLTPASGRTATAHYATADLTATAATDYEAVSGTLTFAAGSERRTVAVSVTDDELDEEDREEFTVTLSAAVNATVAADGRTATGTIQDDDDSPALSIGHASATEAAGGTVRFAVSLEPASARTVTVDYATADGTATAGDDYASASGTLTFHAGSTAQTVGVPILDDDDPEDDETFTVTLRAPRGATVSTATATGTVMDDGDLPPPQLASLQVTGGGTMYPEFDPGTHHYALTCAATLQMTATADRSGTTVTLLRSDTTQNVVAAGTLTTSLNAEEYHDVAIALSDAGGTVTYVVHCLSAEFASIRILAKTEQASAGLLLMTPTQNVDETRYTFMAVVDYNGVPRFHRRVEHGRNLRRYGEGPEINGKRVRYSMSETYNPGHVNLFDDNFGLITTATTVSPLTKTNSHDFLLNGADSMLFMSLPFATRDFSEFTDENGDPLPTEYRARDSVIQEVSISGSELFRWNSWDHLKLRPDCRFINTRDYAHINSLQMIDGDIVASFRNCGTVVRIDRSTGDLVWKLGGTPPPRDPGTAFLDIVDDPAGEFCGQHHATLTGSGTVVLFDNGVHCLGARKQQTPFTRVVEYDISSGTRAVFAREVRRPTGQGLSESTGGVDVLDNGHWLISWGSTSGLAVPLDEYIAISEVDPATGIAHFHVHMSQFNRHVVTYRAYWESEADVTIPLNLP